MDMELLNLNSSKNVKTYILNDKENWNSFFVFFIIIGYIFGVVLYDFLPLSWFDEFMAVSLVGVYFYRWKFYEVTHKKELLIFFCISLFYLIYSFYIKSNVPKAILSDYIVQIKPYLGFFCVLGINPYIDDNKKQVLKKITYLVFAILVVTGLSHKLMYLVFGHPSRFATTAIINGLLYWLSIDKIERKEFLTLILLVSIGFISGRSKFYGFFIILIILLLCKINKYSIKISFLNLILLLITISGTLFVAWDKINYYFIEGVFQSEEAFARPILYLVSLDIFKDFFPFGSGLASFATFHSGEYYSSIYSLYEIDNFWGLSEDFNFFISDTYYPSLAQFGIIGLILFFYFFVRLFNSVKGGFKDLDSYSLIVLSCILFFIIECTSDSTFIQNRGFYVMMIIAVCCNSYNCKKNDYYENYIM